MTRNRAPIRTILTMMAMTEEAKDFDVILYNLDPSDPNLGNSHPAIAALSRRYPSHTPCWDTSLPPHYNFQRPAPRPERDWQEELLAERARFGQASRSTRS